LFRRGSQAVEIVGAQNVQYRSFRAISNELRPNFFRAFFFAVISAPPVGV
jgi:hypothetical protein